SLLHSCVRILRRSCPALFPYTTLFRSRPPDQRQAVRSEPVQCVAQRLLEVVVERDFGALGVVVRHQFLQDGVVPGLLEVGGGARSEEHTSELQSRENLVCRLLLEKKNR